MLCVGTGKKQQYSASVLQLAQRCIILWGTLKSHTEDLPIQYIVYKKVPVDVFVSPSYYDDLVKTQNPMIM